MVTDDTATRETIYVVYAPYLPLSTRITVGRWELIPRGKFENADATDAGTARLAHGLADLHELPRGPHGPTGAFARLRDARVGDDPRELALIVDLQRALVVAALEGNEPPIISEEDRDLNAGHRAVTSDNAIVVAPGIAKDGGWTATITGGRIRTVAGGLSVLRDPGDPVPSPKILPPPDLHLPIMAPKLDHEYADAVWDTIRRGTSQARRLGRAIDWLDLAWRNASSLTDDQRLPALRAGFEVLLDSDKTRELRDRLQALLDAPNAPTQRRHWCDPQSGKTREAVMTDLGWWFTRFSFLRNDIMHGGEPKPDAWRFDGVHQVDLGECRLREAIKETVARNGHPDVREDRFHREIARAWREAFANEKET